MAIEITEQGNVDIWLYDFARDSLTRLTFDAGEDILPTWTPDGRRIVFASNRIGPMDLYWIAADGGVPEKVLLAEPGGQMPGSCSPDGHLLAYTEGPGETGFDIWVLPLEGTGKPRPFLQTPFQERAPAFSPDGRWIAYTSDETGREEVYVRPFPGPGEKWRISIDGGTEPIWSHDEKELFFRSGERMMVAAVRAGASFEARKPAVLFESRSETDPPFRTFQVSADGRRFLMVRRSEPDSPTMPIAVVLNWFEELRRLVPIGKR
jgi:serine/threonine-protein kinase